MGPPQAGGRVLSLVLLDLAGAFAVWAAGWRIGVVTNGEPDNQGAGLRRTGLAEHLDGWCASGEAGGRKPDPAVVGGGRAGFRTWWVGHGRPWPAEWPAPDRTSHDTADALTALLRL
ncbi:HAD family hydrolase [Saccharothrix longispora]|uniref:FMN phosphatase YigB (HAD superfamily) n=1 Tax=Saccharothrix longispora TaxID=33920 RepID=A0ABU1PTC2_9PSEU|nr:hypothetical protein [Saccharothrix longispora]MDR6593364.1 FMN phosphatase YigB (HAD superfamily) [Saccharothrix longispora]